MEFKNLVTFLIFLLVLTGMVLYFYHPEIKVYSIPEPRSGFILSARSDNAFLFMFYEHPDHGLTPLAEYDTLYSNELIVYALAYKSNVTSEKLIIHMYRVEKRVIDNKTVYVKTDVQNITVTLILRSFTITENKIQLPTHDKLYTCEIYTESGRKIFVFYHETHPLFLPAKRYTLGSLFMDRLAYILCAVVLCFTAIAVSRVTIDRRKAVPQLSLGAGLWLLTVCAFIIYITARILIYIFGLLNVLWTFVPIFIASYFFGFSLLKPQVKRIFLMKTLDSPTPTKELIVIDVVEKDGRLYNANVGWLEFLMNKYQEIRFDGEPLWHWRIHNTDDKLFIFREITESNGVITITLEGIHEIDVDQFMSQLKTVESIAREKEFFRKRLLDEIAQKETEIDRRVLEFIKNYERILLMERESE